MADRLQLQCYIQEENNGWGNIHCHQPLCKLQTFEQIKLLYSLVFVIN